MSTPKDRTQDNKLAIGGIVAALIIGLLTIQLN